MPDPSSRVLTGQVATACRQLQRADGLPFAQQLPAQQVQDAVRAAGTPFRQRLYDPATTTWMFLGQCLDPDHSCRAAVARLVAHRAAADLPACSADTGAYCKARARLPEEALARLARRAGQQVLEKAERPWLWKGRAVKVVDGTGLSMPDTPANQAAYPQPSSQKPGLGFPLLRLVVVFSLAVGTALDAALGRSRGKGTGEPSLWRSLRDALGPGDLPLADRYYCSYWEVVRALRCGADVVLRLIAAWERDVTACRRLGPRERLMRLARPRRPPWMADEEYAGVPECLWVRAAHVRVRQRGFRTRALWVVTTLLAPAEATAAELADLYRMRWQAELDLRPLKQTLQMDVLRGRTPGVVRKEVWAHLLAYNLVRGVMAAAARRAGVGPQEVSFAGALQTVNAFLPHLVEADALGRQQLWERLLAAVARHRVGDRPDRYEPRAVKRRPKNFPLLTEPREQARARLAVNS